MTRRGLGAGALACLALLGGASAASAQTRQDAQAAQAGVGLLAVQGRASTPRIAPPPQQGAEERAPRTPDVPPDRAAAVGISASLRFLQGEELVAEIADLRAAGVRYTREDMDWAVIEPQRGRFDWSRWDGLVGTAAQQGLRIIAIPGGSPAWATGAVNRPPTSPEAGAAYAAFVRAAINRYGTRGGFWVENPQLPKVPITLWDVWNEPYEPAGWGGSPDPAAYAQMYRRVLQGTRGADPKARFMLEADTGVASTPWPQPPFLEAMLRADPALAEDIDIVSVHPYSGARSPDDCTPERAATGREFWQGTRFQFCRVRDIRRILDTSGAQKARIWITEMGWSTAPQGKRAVSEDDQAAYLRRAFALLRDWRVVDGVLVYHYQLGEQDPADDLQWFGLVRADGTPKPGWYAFAEELGAGLQAAP